MLDIISMTILLFLLIGLPIILIIIGGNKNKSQQEIEAELKEQSDYLREQMRKKEKYNDSDKIFPMLAVLFYRAFEERCRKENINPVAHFTY